MLMKKLTFAAVGLVAAATLTACGSSETGTGAGAQPGGLAIVVGAHANAPAPILPTEVQQLIAQAGDARSAFSLVSNEGTARAVASGSFQTSAKNAQAQAVELQKSENAVLQAAQSLRAKTAENNLLASIALAARSVQDSAGAKTVVVIDSGLQTTAPLQFQNDGMLDAQPDEVADFVAASGDLPNLTGYTVVLAGLGDVAAPQEELSLGQQQNLRDVWSAVLQRAGATVQVLAAPQTASATSDLPTVTTVPITQPAAFTAPTIAPQQVVTIQLTQDAVAFIADQANYRDPAAADQVLAPLAQQITTQHLTVHLTGSTASAGTPDGRTKLSRARAEAVKASLVAKGVDAAAVTTDGVGSDWPGYVQDRDGAGNLIPAAAAQNRKVTVELSHP
jgi:OOP family OmpA-OmpF porin